MKTVEGQCVDSGDLHTVLKCQALANSKNLQDKKNDFL